MSADSNMASLTPEQIERNAHIPNDEIVRDIEDTEAEVADLERQIKAYALLEDRLSDMRRRAAITGIEERKAFIAKLQAILAHRSSAATPRSGAAQQ